MIDSSATTEIEQKLYAELLHCIALEVFNPYRQPDTPSEEVPRQRRDPLRGRKGDVESHGFIGVFERAFSVLAAFPGVGPSAGGLMLNVDIGELPQLIMRSFPPQVPVLDHVLAAFIGVAVHHGVLSNSRKQFAPPGEYEDLCGLMAATGYLNRIGNRYSWAEKIAPAMQENSFWSADGQSQHDAHEEELARVWQTMPESFRAQTFFSGPVDTLAFAVAYSACWLGDRWDMSRLPVRGSDRLQLSGGGISVCKELVDRFVRRLRPDLI